MLPDGKVLWEDQQETSEYVYQRCAVFAGKMYIVGSSKDAAELYVVVRDTEGALLASRKIQLADSLQSNKGIRLNVFDVDVFSKGIIFSGQQLSNSDEYGFYVVVDEALEPICATRTTG